MMTLTFRGWQKWLLCLVALCGMLSGSAQGAAALSAALSQDKMAVGETIQLTLSVENTGAKISVPREIIVEGLEIRFEQESKSVRMENLNFSSTMELIYSVSAEKPGTYTIPPHRPAGRWQTTADRAAKTYG